MKISRLNKIEITEESITEYDREKIILRLNNSEISNIEIAYGISAERPILEISIYSIIIIAGVFCGLNFLLKYLESPFQYKLAYLDLPMIFMYLAPLWTIFSLYMLFSTLTNKFFLKVSTKNDTRKFQFSQKTKKEEVLNFVNEINDAQFLPGIKGIENLTTAIKRME